MPRFISRRTVVVLSALVLVALLGLWAASRFNVNPTHAPGEVIDQFEGVPVYYNGAINHVDGRSLAPDGYNIGLRWQCVEFVKRYYYERHQHRMPEARGHAKAFFDAAVADGALNAARNLVQHRNGGASAPAVGDIVVFAPWLFNPYGHVAIVSRVDADAVEIVQQNPGPFGTSRERLPLALTAEGRTQLGTERVLGWLRLPTTAAASPKP